MRRHGWRILAVFCVPLLLVPAITQAPTSASGPLLPSQDPFYSYSGPVPLADVPPGTVLKSRSVPLAFGTSITTPVNAIQLLYRTTGQIGQATATVTTVLNPTPVPVVPRIVDYLSFYDGLGSQCDPSYTLAGGDPGGSTNEQQAEEEQLLITWYLSQGDIVVVPDFEGTGLDWMAGRQSGYEAIDAARAAEAYLGLGPSAEIGMSGYSGGALAADFASELAPAYAPQLHIVGVAEGGIPVNDFDLLNYVDGTTEFSAAIPGILLGLSRAYGSDLTQNPQYLSSYGQSVVGQEANVCIASVFGTYPGLTVAQIMAPGYQDLANDPPFNTWVGDQTMGQSGKPAEPLFMAVGNVDGKGDGVMSAVDAKELARQYCHEGVPVVYQEYTGASHVDAGAFFDPQTGPFLQARFSGLPFVGNCAALG